MLLELALQIWVKLMPLGWDVAGPRGGAGPRVGAGWAPPIGSALSSLSLFCSSCCVQHAPPKATMNILVIMITTRWRQGDFKHPSPQSIMLEPAVEYQAITWSGSIVLPGTTFSLQSFRWGWNNIFSVQTSVRLTAKWVPSQHSFMAVLLCGTITMGRRRPMGMRQCCFWPMKREE